MNDYEDMKKREPKTYSLQRVNIGWIGKRADILGLTESAFLNMLISKERGELNDTDFEGSNQDE